MEGRQRVVLGGGAGGELFIAYSIFSCLINHGESARGVGWDGGKVRADNTSSPSPHHPPKTDRERGADRQTDRQIETETDRMRQRQRQTETDTETERQTHRERMRQRQRQTETDIETETERQTQR